jgi:hypothetical protein
MAEHKKGIEGSIINPKTKTRGHDIKCRPTPLAFRTTTIREFGDLVDAIKGKLICHDNPLLVKPLMDIQNPANPKNAFNVTDMVLRCAPRTCEVQKNPINYLSLFQSNMPSFGFPEVFPGELSRYLWKLDPRVIHPKIFMKKYTPSYQMFSMEPFINRVLAHTPPEVKEKFIERQQQCDAFVEHDDLVDMHRRMAEVAGYNVPEEKPDEMVFEDYADQEAIIRMLSDPALMESMRSDNKVLLHEHAPILVELATIQDNDEFVQKYKEFEEAGLKRAVGRIFENPDANTSANSGRILDWFRKNIVNKPLPFLHRKTDPELTVFGSMVARMMLEFEHIGFISNSHMPLLIMMVGCLDAYRYANDLHFNFLGFGPAATGKSHNIVILAEYMIPR